MEHAVALPVLWVTHAQRRFHLRIAEWLTASMTVCWGLELALAPNMFGVPYFSGFARLAPQAAWAVFALLIGMSRLAALIINGHWRFSPHLRAALALLSAAGWAAIVVGVWSVGRPTLGHVVYPWLALADLYAVSRAARDARVSDEVASAAVATY